MELGSSLSRASTVLRSTKSSEMCLQVLDSQSSLLQARFQHLCKSTGNRGRQEHIPSCNRQSFSRTQECARSCLQSDESPPRFRTAMNKRY